MGTVVWARGEIDAATEPDLTQELAEAVRTHPCRVIVDLTQVTFMDSTGFNALVRARAEGNGELRLVGASGMVYEVLRMTGLEEVLTVHSTIEESIGQGAAGAAVPRKRHRHPTPGAGRVPGLSSLSLHKQTPSAAAIRTCRVEYGMA